MLFFTGFLHGYVEQQTLFGVVAAAEQIFQIADFVHLHIRRKAEPADIDADQRRVGAGSVFCRVDNGAVTADGDSHVREFKKLLQAVGKGGAAVCKPLRAVRRHEHLGAGRLHVGDNLRGTADCLFLCQVYYNCNSHTLTLFRQLFVERRVRLLHQLLG